MTMTRRAAGRLLLGAPAVAMVASGLLKSQSALAADEAAAGQAAATPAPPPGSALGKFLSKQEPGLDRDQKEKVRRDVASLEQALQTLRDFPLGNDVPPAGTFRPIRSRRAPGAAGGKRPAQGAGSRK